jgi:hypothetical protein
MLSTAKQAIVIVTEENIYKNYTPIFVWNNFLRSLAKN